MNIKETIRLFGELQQKVLKVCRDIEIKEMAIKK